MEIHISPAQESYEIGSRVTLNCTATPSSQNYENFTFPLRYQWYLSGWLSYFTTSSTRTITVASYGQGIENYYCLIYQYHYGSDLLLAQGRTTITTKGIMYMYIYET